jgi:CheY-like chemotaxis protein
MGSVIPWPLTVSARFAHDTSPGPAFLIGEANLQSVSMLRAFLLSRGLRARCLADGTAVIEALTRIHEHGAPGGHPVDVVIIDVDMPGRSGIDVLATVRQHGWPVHMVLTSTMVSRSLRSQLMRMGAAAVLSKPFSLPQLKRMLKAVTTEGDGPMK